jgi:glutamine amidotransferase
MNLLFSEGQHLFAYHDVNGYNGLSFTHRRAPFSRVSLHDEDWCVDLAEEKSRQQRGYIVATSPLTEGEKWKDAGPGTLLVVRDGEIVFQE